MSKKENNCINKPEYHKKIMEALNSGKICYCCIKFAEYDEWDETHTGWIKDYSPDLGCYITVTNIFVSLAKPIREC